MAARKTQGDGGCRTASPSSPSRHDLVAAWRKDHGSPPPKRTSNRLLLLSAAYHAQIEEHGPLSRRAERELVQWVGATARRMAPKEIGGSNSKLRVGTRLIREWNGLEHIVDVVEGGFLYDGAVHRSLSKIARTITGAHWSGPRFFGVPKR